MYVLKRGDMQYNAPGLDVLKQWAQAGSILPTDMIFDPQTNKWVQASQFPGISEIISSGAGTGERAVQQGVPSDFVVVTTENVPGREIERVFGVVYGSTVRAKHIGRDFLAGLKNIVGGEISEYTEMLEESRRLATERMTKSAVSLGANCVVNVRYTTSSLAQGAAEILAYGTAVKLK